MRMRELEERTGVGRETIRYYIREGLLPEPERSARNAASYTADHVDRVRAIKRLQEERFLPLAVIRSLLDADDGDRWLHAEAFPHLDTLLRARLGEGGRVSVDRVAADLSLARAEIEEAAARGTVEIGPDDALTARDVAILRALAELRAIGFTREAGFDGMGVDLYRRAVDWIVTEELKHFLDHTAGHVDEAKAVDMAERGIAAVNEVLSHMRTREILRRLEARRRIANDNL